MFVGVARYGEFCSSTQNPVDTVNSFNGIQTFPSHSRSG